MEDLVNLFMNSSVSIACLIYFMWYNKKYAEKTNEILIELKAYIEHLLEKEGKAEK